MRHRIFVLFLSAVVASASIPAFSKLDRPPPRPTEIKQPPETKPGKTDPPPEGQQHPALESPATIESIPAPQAQNEPANDAKKADAKSSADWWMVWLTGVLAFVAFLQLVVFGLQARRLKQTIDTMQSLGREQREIGESQTRAYVHIKSAVIEFAVDGLVPIITFIAFNSGQSPALRFTWNITLQYFVGGETKESIFNEELSDCVNIDIPAASDSPANSAGITNMSAKQYIESSIRPIVVRIKIGFIFTDVFDKNWSGEAYFGGVAQRTSVSQEDMRRGVSQWISKLAPMSKPRDWEDINNANKE
jgi:hypothetical protein